MSFLFNNMVVVHIALVACGFAWVFGGIVSDKLTPVMPWLWAFMFEAMLCFPQRRGYESSYDARERVWTELKRDPLTKLSLIFTALMLIPLFNTALCPVCDYPAIVDAVAKTGKTPDDAALGMNSVLALAREEGILDPIMPFLPYCVNRLQHFNVLMWFVPALTAMLAVKHALSKHGKRLLMEVIVWNGVALAVLGAIQQVVEAPGPLWEEFEGKSVYFFSTFGYPNMAGDYFTTMFAIAVGLWRFRVDESIRRDRESDVNQGSAHRRFWARHYLLIAVVINFLAALNTFSRATILLIIVLTVIFSAHTFTSFFARMKKVERVRYSAITLFVLAAIVVFSAVLLPSELKNEVDTLDTREVLTRVTGKGQYHARVATAIWKSNFLFGCGGWGYKHYCISEMTEDELKNIQQVGGINVHNDYLQFLAEHGIVGFGILFAIVVLLLWPTMKIWRMMALSIRFIPPKKQPPKPTSFFILPAPVFCILAGATASIIHGFGDCPFRSPAVLTLFFVSLASADGFLPRLKQEEN